MPILQVKSNEQIEADEQEAIREGRMIVNKPVPLNSLSGYVISAWQEARTSKQQIKDEMKAFLRQRNGEYSVQKKQEITAYGGSAIFMRLTDEKSTACKAWVNELMVDDTPWSITPTPLPDLPDAVDDQIEQQVMMEFEAQVQSGMYDPFELEQRARSLKLEIQHKTFKIAEQESKRVESKIKDILEEGNWKQAFKDVIEDIVDLHVGIMKGPIIKQRDELTWVDSDDPNATGLMPEVKKKFVIEFERVSPFDIYPSPVASGINDGYLIEKHVLTRSSLSAMKGIPGYIDSQINDVLEQNTNGQLTNWLDTDEHTFGVTYEQEKDKTYQTPSVDAKIEALQFWGKIQGKKLKEFDIRVKNDLDEYEAEVWVIGHNVIKAEINGDPLGRRPYYKASFRERNGSFWGSGLPETIYDIQDMVNAAARNLVNNMAFASGPQTGIDISRLAEGENPTGLTPNRIWQFDETMNVSSGGRPPIWFFQPKSLVGELLRTYEFFSTEADNKTGIPKYSYGSGGSAGALGTATGMSMMMSNASRGVKQVVANIDFGIIQPAITSIYEWLLMYANEEDQYRADIKVVAKGSAGLIAKEQQQIRRNEFLQIALNPAVTEIIGRKGLASILRTVSQGLDFGEADIIPGSAELDLQEFQQQQQLQQQQLMEQAQAANQQEGAQTTMPSGEQAGGGDINAFQQGRV